MLKLPFNSTVSKIPHSRSRCASCSPSPQPENMAAQPAAVPFLKTPGHGAAVIDYTTSQGQKLWYETTKGTVSKIELEANSLLRSLEDILAHAVDAGWTQPGGNIIDIPVGPPAIQGQPRQTKNLITHFSQITEAEVRAHAASYMQGQDRQVQNAIQMHAYLRNSLSETAKNKLLAQRDFYFVDSDAHGPLFFFLMMSKVCASNEATILQLRDALTHLDTYMTTVNWNIELFNQHVSELREGLLSRGASVHESELILQLFRAYSVVADANFTRYIEGVRNNYEDQLRIVTTDQLMQLALNKYRTLKLRGEWTQPTSEAKQLQALSAQIAALKDKQLKLSTHKSGQKDKKGKGKETGTGKGKKDKKGNKKGKKGSERWAWLLIPPKDGEPKSKVTDGIEWHWCDNHNKWQHHTTEECRLGKDTGDQKKQGGKPYVARGAVVEDEEETSSDEDSI